MAAGAVQQDAPEEAVLHGQALGAAVGGALQDVSGAVAQHAAQAVVVAA